VSISSAIDLFVRAHANAVTFLHCDAFKAAREAEASGDLDLARHILRGIANDIPIATRKRFLDAVEEPSQQKLGGVG